MDRLVRTLQTKPLFDRKLRVPLVHRQEGTKMIEKHDKESWEQFFKDFTYKPNWHFETQYMADFDELYLDIIMRVPNSREPDVMRKTLIRVSRRICLSYYVNDTYALHTIRGYIRSMEDHEVDEWIRFKGELVHDPHLED